MIANVRIDYFELLDHWSWSVSVDDHSEYGVEGTYDNAMAAAEFSLQGMLEERE